MDLENILASLSGRMTEHVDTSHKPTVSKETVKAKLDKVSTELCKLWGEVLPLENAYFAGGCIRDLYTGDKPKDYDIYFTRLEDVQKVKRFFDTQNGIKFTPLGNYECQVTVGLEVITCQFITLIYGECQAVVDTFDFTMNMNYYTFAEEVLFIHYSANCLQLIPGQKIARPLHALCRVQKFIKRGYFISHRQLIELAALALDVPVPEAKLKEELSHLISGD